MGLYLILRSLLGKFQVKDQMNTPPNPPSLALGVGPTPPPCKRSIVTESSNTALMQQDLGTRMSPRRSIMITATQGKPKGNCEVEAASNNVPRRYQRWVHGTGCRCSIRPSPSIGYTKTTSEETPVTNQLKDSLQCGFAEDKKCARAVPKKVFQ